jgi:uncharacterized protein (DUF1697 family)
MNIYIALFRGINVGGKNILPTKELVGILEGLGCQNVKTYIQSGNVVLKSNEKNVSELSGSISTEIKKRRGFAPFVLLLSLVELEKMAANNPFPEVKNDPKAVHFGFLASVPKEPDLKTLESLRGEQERFHLIDNIFYLHAPDGVGRSKLAANIERLLGVSMTDRNWRTVCKIFEMAKELDSERPTQPEADGED